MKTYKLQKENGQYFTEPILNEEEWLQVLHSADNDQHRRQLDVIRMFLCQPGHKATCSKVGKEYSMNDTAVNSLVVHFCKFVQKSSGKDFRVESHESTDDTFWPIAMYGRYVMGDLFEWELKPELVAALQQFLLEKLLLEYRGPILEKGLDNDRSKELYKWRFLHSVQGKSIEDKLVVMGTKSRDMNFLTWRTQDSIKAALQDNHEKIIECFSLLLEEGDFYTKYEKFVAYGKSFLSKTAADRILKEKEACLFLALCDPQKNPVYKWTLFKDACDYLGIDNKTSRPVESYLDILNRIIELENKDTELVEKLRSETEPFFWSELLNAQDVLFQMQVYMRQVMPKNWLQRQYDMAFTLSDNPFEEWFPEYERSVKLFRGMFEEGMTSKDVSEETKDYFIRTQDNFISSNGHGMYSYAEYEKILDNWDAIYDILKRNVIADTIEPSDYDALDKIITPLLTKNRPAAYHRLWAGLFPEQITSIIADLRFYQIYDKIHAIDDSLPNKTGYWLQDNLTLTGYFRKKVVFRHPWHIGIFAWYLRQSLKIKDNNTDMDKYVKLLEANKNIVLTGAPGTGKTYLARQIAKAMGDDNPGFIQFHPSYDYTDFVEGLRPYDEGSFDRVNGIFKQFCAEALTKLDQSSFDDAYEKLLKDLSERTSPLIVKAGVNDSISFGIMVNSRGSLDLFTKTRVNESLFSDEGTKNGTLYPVDEECAYNKNGSLTKERILDCDNQKYWKAYYTGVKKLLVDKYGFKEGAPASKPKDRVFIIDEINRGELSKIFGELFFAIEPGYRGEAGRVKTQYQNLVEPGDPFEKGFFVPDNVFIIGTMNDIDRGVESMDFAIRRRFAWIEVKAMDRIDMWDDNIPDWKEAALRSMSALNDALKQKEIGLTDAYDIGPAYFLKLEKYDGEFEKLWDYHIKVILSEYLRGTRGIEEKLTILKEAFDSYKGK